jgi:nitrogen fixation protein NifQ
MNPSHDCREQLQAHLLGRPACAGAGDDPLRPLLASLLTGRALHQGVLSATLGLPQADFQDLWRDYFPGDALQLHDGPGEDIVELEDLLQLLLEYRAGLRDSEVWAARIVAYSCCGRNHLWQDLGLANRGELSLLMSTAFPALAALNSGDMKWKKFIYRHYCSREGIYVCPAPSCAECADYAKCFAKED